MCETKTCTKCGQNLPLSKFYKKATAPDGFYSQCKACMAVRQRAYYACNPEKKTRQKEQVAAWNSRYGVQARLTRRVSRRAHDSIMLKTEEWYETKRRQRRESAQRCRFSTGSMKRRRIHAYLRRVIAKGLIIPIPCMICASPQSHAHHCDYNKPLEVMWLCVRHHKAWHYLFEAENRE